jgi:hypothetical protein
MKDWLLIGAFFAGSALVLAQEDKKQDPFVVTALQEGPNDQTGDALYRAKTVEFKRLTYENVNGTFYEVYLDGGLMEPRERRANGYLVVEIPHFGEFKCPEDLLKELYDQGLLEVRTFSRPRK